MAEVYVFPITPFCLPYRVSQGQLLLQASGLSSSQEWLCSAPCMTV